MRRSRVWATVVTLLLLVGQAALSLASTSAPCACHESRTRHACCCGHPEGESCPSSPHGGSGPKRVKGSCAHDELAATGGSMEATPQAATPPPALPAATFVSSASDAPRLIAAWHGPPLPSGRLTALRTVVLRN